MPQFLGDMGKQRKHLIIAGAGLVLAAGALVLVFRPPGVKGNTPQERIAAIDKLANERQGAKDVAEAAKDPDAGVRRAAIRGLAIFVDPQHRPAVEAATQDPAPQVRAAAATTLGLYQDAPAAERVGRLMNGDPEEKVRLSAAAGLGQNNTPDAMVLLMEAAEKNDNPNVQLRAMEVLMEKFHMRFIKTTDPRDVNSWRVFLEMAKSYPAVYAAYQKLGRTLERHPEIINVPAGHMQKYQTPP
jgi:hypothetical protein